jgi:molecular chaperone IbpA
MRTYDFSPLYRSTVGFDRLFDMLDQANRVESMTNFPPYNIERVSEDEYRITMAVAGFSADEIEMVHHENRLTFKGHKKEQEEAHYLHRGIATRSFTQTFNVADHVKVTGARLDNGLLTVELKREVPEALRPRRIQISTSGAPTTLQQDNKHQQIDREAQDIKAA